MMTKDLEFAVDDAGGNQKIFTSFDKACGFAVSIAASNGQGVNVDVLCYSAKGARAFMGEEGVERYKEDPDASVFSRVTINAEDHGRIA
jgi:uncharacterized ParB-like nuclease family protein